MNFGLRVLLSALALWLTSVLMPNRFHLLGSNTTVGLIISALAVALVLTLVNAIIRPFVKVLSLPLYLLTFGLFSLVVNGLMLWLTSHFATGQILGNPVGLQVTGGVMGYLWAAVVLSLVQTVVGRFARSSGVSRNARRAQLAS